jgi:hypothetical protein
MFPARSRIICLASVWLLGCSGGGPKPLPPGRPGMVSKATLLGERTTSNAPELAASATTMRFSESGEYFASSPMSLFGKPVTYKDDSGKEQPVPFQGSGTWKQEGDKLTVHLTQGNIQGFKAEPVSCRIVSQTERQLVLEGADGRTTAYFRPEGRQ